MRLKVRETNLTYEEESPLYFWVEEKSGEIYLYAAHEACPKTKILKINSSGYLQRFLDLPKDLKLPLNLFGALIEEY